MPIRKRLIDQAGSHTAADWLPVAQLAQVEVTSEEPSYPIESALTGEGDGGWRASREGEQLIRLVFDEPQDIRRIHLVFEDAEQERTHEFSVRCSSDGGVTHQSVVRQQFSFSPSGATREVEEYDVRLTGVTHLELHIVPDISRRPVVATLSELRLR